MVRPLKSPKKLSLANFRIPDRGPGLASHHHVNFHHQTARKLKCPGSCGFTGQNILRWETLRRLLGLQLRKQSLYFRGPKKHQTVQNRVKKLFLTRLIGVAAGRKASRMLPLFCCRLTAARQRVFDFAHARVAAHGGRKTQSRSGSVKKPPR